MFKKRNINKSVNLSQELSNIESNTEQPHSALNNRSKLSQNREEEHIKHMQPQQNQVSIEMGQPEDIDLKKNESVNSEIKQIQECFEEFKKYHMQQQEQQRRQQEYTSIFTHGNAKDQNQSGQASFIQDQDDMQVIGHQNNKRQIRPQSMLNQLIIQQEPSNLLQYEENYGQISPQSQQDQQNQQGYENQLIRRNISRQVYESLHSSMKKNRKMSQRDKLLKKINKINHASIYRVISRDVKDKQAKSSQINHQIRYIEDRLRRKKEDVRNKEEQKEIANASFFKIKQIMQLIYFYGDQIQYFQEAYINNMMQNPIFIRRLQKIKKHQVKKQREKQEKMLNAKNKIKKRRSQVMQQDEQQQIQGYKKYSRDDKYIDDDDDDCIMID